MSSSRKITMYGIPNCDTVKKARTWLEEQEIPFHFHNFKKDGLNKSAIEQWLTKSDLTILINRKGTTWRALSDVQKAQADTTSGAIALMLENPSVIKRPVLVIEQESELSIAVSFKPDQYQTLFSSAA
ncbi:ArsC family reductase [Undibacterium sp. LX40W]|uniref:ArsC family reductase n=1 Tax=Undibacterium nitidum TaxID=2762298 RepID=A0A923KJV4_9BURK|nr:MULTISPECIES: ArsC family reductase [Undibacterium]MBC3880065.1 ArsC family reductase [Undibacterium nitidum]MBC3891199.1 ArsC family reductase [Undibacterium sp. LX40W]